MKILTKLAGAWKLTKEYWYKAPPGWPLVGWIAVRRVFVKVNGQWKRTYIRNSFTVFALGLLQQQVPNGWVGVTMNARGIAGGARSYSLAQFTRDGELSFFRSYDIFADGNYGTTDATISMAADLNAMPNDQIFVVYSFDEPSAGHTHPLLVEAIERVGGVPGVYSQPMAYRGAYMLLGKVGFPCYFERYVGAPTGGTEAGDGDPFAWIVSRFTIIENQVLLMGPNWNWGHAVKRDVHVVYALGGFSTVFPLEKAGTWVSDTVHPETKTTLGKRSFNLVKFNANNGITFSGHYDVYLDTNNGVLTSTNQLIGDLNAMPDGQVFTLLTYDEPKYGHLHPELVTAVLRVGGTNAIYNQTWGYRGAYVLIGKVGSDAKYEKYVGEDLGDGDLFGDPLAAIRMSFFVEDNEIHLVQ